MRCNCTSSYTQTNGSGGDFDPMAKVVVKPDEPIGSALRRFKKICDKEGVINRAKRNERFEKPAERRRREEMDRIKTIRKAQNAAGDMATG